MLPDLGRESTVSGNIKLLSSRYRCAAMQCLAADSVVSRHSIRSLQALVLILYARTHSAQSTWTLLGFTHHVAISMGCHIDPERFGLAPVECEERRRAWAGLIMLYTIQNTSFGSLDARFLSHDVKLPADVDDLDLLTGMCDRGPRGRPTQMTYLLMKFRLYEISAKICQGIFNVSGRPPPSVTELEQEIMVIQEACRERYLLDASREPLPSHHMANLNIIYSYINQLSLLLYRPLFRKYFEGDARPATRNARDRCVEAARGILSIYKNMLETQQFSEYKWYTGGLGSFHAFHAAVTLVVVLMHADNHAEFEDIKRLLNESVDLFLSLVHRSTICNKVVPILRNFMYVLLPLEPVYRRLLIHSCSTGPSHVKVLASRILPVRRPGISPRLRRWRFPWMFFLLSCSQSSGSAQRLLRGISLRRMLKPLKWSRCSKSRPFRSGPLGSHGG
jgi:hypothetical protein